MSDPMNVNPLTPHSFKEHRGRPGVCVHCEHPADSSVHYFPGAVLPAVQTQKKHQPFEYDSEKRIYASGTTSTKQPRLSLVPHQGLIRAAKRFELGLERHGERAWNNLSNNQAALQDREWLIERCSHAINHLYNLIDKLKGSSPLEGDDDAGAVAWCGLVLGEAMEILERKNIADGQKTS